jgi:hypothetical protein
MKFRANNGGAAKRPEREHPVQPPAPPAAPASRWSGPNELARAA